MDLDHTFHGYVEAESSKAIYFQSHYWYSPMWLPKSQIEIALPWNCTEIQVRVKNWLCKKNDLHEFEEGIKDG